MTMSFTRREAIGVLAIGSTFAWAPGAWAQAGTSLDQLRKAGVLKIGIANQPPYSGLNPDGTVTGLAPAVVQTIMGRLGVPKIEGHIAPYGQLIPGLQAGRWDMIGAALTITKARCEQVRYADPIVFDGGSIAYAPGTPAPKSIEDAGKQGLKVGMLTGSYLLQSAQKLGVPAANISQFQDNPSLMDGLAARRIQIAISTYSALRDLRKARNNAFDIVYPLPDDLPHGSSGAFRPGDTEFHAAYQAELKKMKQSGEFLKLSQQHGFEVPAGSLNMTADEACAKAT